MFSWFHNFQTETETRSNSLLRELFRGYFPLFTRQCVAWVSFLWADQFMKTTLRAHFNLQQTEKLPRLPLTIGSITVAVFSTLVIMPFDSMKTHMQKANLTAMTQKDAFLSVYSQSGMRGLFVGWRIRFAQYVLTAIMTGDLLDRLEVTMRKLDSKSD